MAGQTATVALRVQLQEGALRLPSADLQHSISVAARRSVQELVGARFILTRDVARHQRPDPHQI
jgi:hypothetical protein